MDLLDKVGKSNSATPSNTGNIPPVSPVNQDRGDNLLDRVAKPTAATVETVTKPTTSSEESVTSTVSDLDSWSTESALKEVKKLRNENKNNRLKYEESLTEIKTQTEAQVAAIKAEQEELRKAADRLAQLEAQQEDKKRDLAERLAHREALLAQTKAEAEAKERMLLQEKEKLNSKLAVYEAEHKAQLRSYEERLEKELASVPEKFKEVATYIVKGAGDPRDALVALSEAKLKGFFEEKTVVVNHSVPGAKDGARSDQGRIDALKEAERSKMSSSQKISQALKGIKSGEKNTAFRTR